MDEKLDEMNEKIEDFSIEHPTAFAVLVTGAATVVSLPLMYLLFRWYGGAVGKGAVKELVKSGVVI